MNRLGLALSGGGFRATLYHLGVIRCLKDNGVLPKITHITTVSGGSVIGAHLALNWERYCGTNEQFDEAAAEIIRFVKLDVRNRIVRRFPIGLFGNWGRALILKKPIRQWTRPGLLERYYEQHLFGDTPLSQLPAHPRLHILATNLSEGCLCSFNQNGLLMQRRVAGHSDRFQRIQSDLATVPMAVAASSCFPGFFPPLELTGWDVGAEIGEFSRQAFTDGGVYDNLGLRMFRCLEQSWVRHANPLRREDFLALSDTMSALYSARELPVQTPLHKLRMLVDRHVAQDFAQEETDDTSPSFQRNMISGLWEVIRSEALFMDPIFAGCDLADLSAQALLKFTTDSQREPEVGDRLWLNRLIVESAIRQVIGQPSIRLSKQTFDGILVSDAGGKFKISPGKSGGLVNTALRASDILMNRVWQLELEAFRNTAGIAFMPITEIVDQRQYPEALAPEVQRQVSNIRTDIDRFSDLEISALVQHGYGVAKQACQQNHNLMECETSNATSWNPFNVAGQSPVQDPEASSSGEAKRSSLNQARQLRASAKRKILSRLFNVADWPSYLWLAFVTILIASIATFILQRSARLRQQESVLSAVASLNPDYRMIVELLRTDGLVDFNPMPYEVVDSMEEPDLSPFEVVSESRVFDLRPWQERAPGNHALGYARTRIRRIDGSSGKSIVRLQRDIEQENYQIDCKSVGLSPSLSRMDLGDGLYRWELTLDLGHRPSDSEQEIVTQTILPEQFASFNKDQGSFNFNVRTDTGLLQVWLLMPKNRDFDSFEVISYPIGQPELAEIVVPAATVNVSEESVATFQLISPKPQRCYECRWIWGDN